MPYIKWVKALLIAAAFIYVYMQPDWIPFGNSSLLWFVLVVLFGFNIYFATRMRGDPRQRERLHYIAFGLDLLTVAYLFVLNAGGALAMLTLLTLLIGYYGLVLPANGGLSTGMLCILLFVFSVIASSGKMAHSADAGVLLAGMMFGVAVLVTSVMVMRRVKQGIDELYTVSDTLAFDLSAQAVDAEIGIEVMVQRNREVQTLLQILENFVAVLDFDALFTNIISAFRNRFDFDKFTLYLYNSETEHLDLRLESGTEPGTGVAKSVRTDYGVVGWCFTHGRGVVIEDVKKDERFAEFNPRARKLRSLACQPLIFRGERLGVLCLDSEKVNSFDENTFAFLESVVPLISVAVSNSMHYSIAKEESLTDNLTKLNNHRGFMDKFLAMLETAYCKDVPLTLLIVDIDLFKKVNDSYGHLVGNIVLTELASLLTEFFRGSDLVARYGGEEFVIVLRGTPTDIAPRIAEQFRRKVASHQFPISLERDAFKQVTISLGVSTTLDSNLEPDIVHGSRGAEGDVFLRNREEIGAQIIDNADQALYAAKREGRNQVMLSVHFPLKKEDEMVVSITDD